MKIYQLKNFNFYSCENLFIVHGRVLIMYCRERHILRFPGMLKRYKRWCYRQKKNIEKFYILDDPSFNKFLILSILNPYRVII